MFYERFVFVAPLSMMMHSMKPFDVVATSKKLIGTTSRFKGSMQPRGYQVELILPFRVICLYH